MTKNINIKDYDQITGVPCSKVKNLFDQIPRGKYIPNTKEDEAVAMAAGCYLVGKKPLVIIQNSGLGNCVDIITSLLVPYKIDIPMIISGRTKPAHHAFMGEITKELLKLIQYDRNILEIRWQE